jgi:NAD(P)-dependent dehydrogenase (short-subunit alcohol dehydrogenase family)
MDRLKGKRALITGGTTGIGLETARQFVKEGARVAITGTNPKTLDAARKELPSDVLVIASDASDVSAQKVREAFGSLDILFVNAGIVDMRPLEQWDDAAFDRSFAINLKGAFFLVQALLPLFANPASIVLNGSVNAHIGMPNTTVYAATKAAMISLARTLSYASFRGISLSRVCPSGCIDSTPRTSTGYTSMRVAASRADTRCNWSPLVKESNGNPAEIQIRFLRPGITATDRASCVSASSVSR